MRRFNVLLLCLLICSLFGGIVSAQDTADVREMARYFPANNPVIFLAVNLSDGHVNQLLDMMDTSIAMPSVQALYQQMNLPVTSMRDMVEKALQESDLKVSLADLLAWLGDNAAMSLWAQDGQTEPGGYFVLQVADRVGLEAKLKMLMPSVTPTSEGAFTVYSIENTGFALSDDLLLLYNNKVGKPVLPDGDSLATDATFQAAMATLPNDVYQVAAFFNVQAAPSDASFDSLQQTVGKIGPVAIGGTLVNDTNLVLDVSVVPGEALSGVEASSVNPAFLRNVPSDTMAVIAAHDLSNLFTSVLGTVQKIANASGDATDTNAIAMQAGMFLGLNTQDDLLSWAHGDYALFADADWAAIFAGMSDQKLVLDNSLNFGLVIEATDAEKAATLAKKLGHSLAIMLMSQEQAGITAKEDTVDGKPLTTLHIEGGDSSGSLKLDIQIGATDSVFFIATAPVADHIRSGEAGMDGDLRWQEASALTLPNPTSLWYLTPDALAGMSAASMMSVLGFSSAVTPAALDYGSSIDGSVSASATSQPAAMSFSGAAQPINKTPVPEATATPLPTPEPTVAPTTPTVDVNSPAFFQQFMSEQQGLYHSATISTAISADGVVHIRFVNSFQKPA